MEFVKLIGPFGTVFIMFCLGLHLSYEDFFKIIKKPNDLIVGLIIQILLLPIIGLAIIHVYPMRPEFQLGVFLLLILPSAVMSNYSTKLVDGNVALSITLTSLAALFSFITIAVYLNLFSLIFAAENFNLNLIAFSIKIFLFISLPTLLGIFLRNKFPNYIIPKKFALDRAALIVFMFIILYAIYTERFNLGQYFRDTGLISFSIAFSIVLVVYLMTSIFINEKGSQRAIRIEALLQNGAMGIVVGAQIFDSLIYITPIAIYALVQYIFLMFYIINVKMKD